MVFNGRVRISNPQFAYCKPTSKSCESIILENWRLSQFPPTCSPPHRLLSKHFSTAGKERLVKTQFWIEFWNSISSSLFKYFFVCLSRETLDRFFILLHHCFYSCKPQICTKQTGLTIRFAIPQKNLCSCVQKIKNKHDGGEDVALFVSACVTHSLVERMYQLTALLGNKDKSPGNVEE